LMLFVRYILLLFGGLALPGCCVVTHTIHRSTAVITTTSEFSDKTICQKKDTCHSTPKWQQQI